MKSLKKRIVHFIKRKQIAHIMLATIVIFYMRVVLKTARQTHDLPDKSALLLQSDTPIIFAIWHSRILLICALNNRRLQQKNLKLHAIVSNHNDGRLIGRVLSSTGVGVVYGSTSKGGAHAMRQLIALHDAGCHIAITPDGPRGPNQVAGAGVAQLAMLTGAPVMCVSSTASRCIRLKSWDKFIIALPFSKVHFTYSEPIFAIGAGKDCREELRLQIETELNKLTQQAEAKIN